VLQRGKGQTVLIDNEWRRGWRLLVASTIGIACGSATLPFYSMGALLKPLAQAQRWSRTDIQTALVISLWLAGLSAPYVAWLIERIGPRRAVLSGLCGTAVGFVIAACADGSLRLFYFSYVCVALLGAGANPLSWTATIAAEFNRKRGFALGIALTGTGVGAMLLPQYTVWLLEDFGWQGAYLGLAALPLLALFVAYVGFEPSTATGASSHPRTSAPADLTLIGMTLSEAMGTYRFWILFVSFVVTYFGITSIIPNLVPALTDRGVALHTAANAQSMLGVSIIAGRLLIGYLIDRLWAPLVASCALGSCVIACCVLAWQSGFGWTLSAAGMIGLAAGAELDLLAYLTVRYFGIRNYSRIYAVMYAGIVLAAGISPAAFAYLHQRSGSYAAGFLACAAMVGCGALAMLTLGPYPQLSKARA
jgi:MFS family permease